MYISVASVLRLCNFSWGRRLIFALQDLYLLNFKLVIWPNFVANDACSGASRRHFAALLRTLSIHAGRQLDGQGIQGKVFSICSVLAWNGHLGFLQELCKAIATLYFSALS